MNGALKQFIRPRLYALHDGLQTDVRPERRGRISVLTVNLRHTWIDVC